MSSYVSKDKDKLAPLALIGALGVVGYLAYDYLSNQSGSYIGGSSGGGYYTPEGSPLMAAGGYSLPTDNNPAPAQSYAPLNYGTTNDRANAQFITESKKEQSTNSDSLLRSAVSGASYTELTSADIAAYNAALLKSIESEDRTGGGSVGSALAFMGIGQGAQYVATIPNTAGISNAGANLTSIIYDSGAYEVRDWRGNIVGSGSAGSFQALGTATKKEEKTTATAGAVSTPYTTATISGGGTYAVKSGSAYSYSGGGGGGSSSSSSSKKESVPITADKATAIKKPIITATTSTGGIYMISGGTTKQMGTYSSGGGSSSSSSSKKSTVSSGGYAQGGAVRSNTTAGKYTGK